MQVSTVSKSSTQPQVGRRQNRLDKDVPCDGRPNMVMRTVASIRRQISVVQQALNCNKEREALQSLPRLFRVGAGLGVRRVPERSLPPSGVRKRPVRQPFTRRQHGVYQHTSTGVKKMSAGSLPSVVQPGYSGLSLQASGRLTGPSLRGGTRYSGVCCGATPLAGRWRCKYRHAGSAASICPGPGRWDVRGR